MFYLEFAFMPNWESTKMDHDSMLCKKTCIEYKTNKNECKKVNKTGEREK